MDGGAADFVKAVETHAKYDEWRKLVAEREELEQKEFDVFKDYALHARFMRSLENVVLAANLEKEGSEEVREKYAELLEAERGGFGG